MSPVDLLSWPELEAARAEVDRARDAYDCATIAVQRAFKGVRIERKKALRTANLKLIQAELHLARVERSL